MLPCSIQHSIRLCPNRLICMRCRISLYKDNGIRRYGMHGTSHYYISLMAAENTEQAS